LTETESSGGAARILVVYNTARWLYRFRLPLIQALQSRGYEVIAVSPPDEFVDRLESAGVRHLEISLNRKGLNPLEDVALLWRLRRLFEAQRPDLILTFTVKPNVYGSMAARKLGIPVVATIPGLGSLFVRRSLLTRLVSRLYRAALRSPRAVVFQNEEDRSLFVNGGLVPPEVAVRIPGSGVDTTRFAPEDGPARAPGDPFVFLFAGRFLWAKGIGDLVEATRILQERGEKLETRILGFFEPPGATAISPRQVEEWVEEGVLVHLGSSDQVAGHMRAADCIVLPTYYREGLPRTLLEAASLGKPVIASDATGCREVVVDGVNGFLCRPADPEDLAEKMAAMIRMSPAERERMGRAGRERVEAEFDEKRVISRYLEVIEEVLAGGTRGKRAGTPTVPEPQPPPPPRDGAPGTSDHSKG
jgi:glycosyltransferase involved in cell wall biosynthesis